MFVAAMSHSGSDDPLSNLRIPYVVCYAISCLVSAVSFYLKGKIYLGLLRRRRTEFSDEVDINRQI